MNVKALINRYQTIFSAGIITIAAVVGQVISIGNIFLITTNLFSQEIFGTYSVFLSYLMIFSTISLMSYEKAIPNLENEELKDLFYGMLLILLLVSGAIILFSSFILRYEYSVWLGLAVMFNGLFRISGMINVRNKNVAQLVFSRIGPQFFLGIGLIYLYLTVGQEGSVGDLIRIYLLSSVVSTVVYFVLTKTYNYFSQAFDFQESKRILSQEIKFFLLVAPSNILNRLAYNLPVILIERFFGNGVAGQYSLVLRLGFGPLVIIGNSVNQLYHGKLAELYRKGGEGIYALYSKTIKVMFGLGFLSFLGFLFIAPYIIAFFFGEEWEMAGTFMQIFSPFFGVMVVVAPITVAFLVLQDQRNEFKNQLLYFLIAAFSFGIGVWRNDIMIAIVLFSLLSFLRYSYMLLQLKRLHQRFS